MKLAGVRVCAVIPSLQPGGAQRSLARTLTIMVAAGAEVGAITFRDDRTAIPLLPLPTSVRVTNLDVRRFRDPRLIPRLRSAIRREGPNLVLAWSHHANLACTAARGSGDPWGTVANVRLSVDGLTDRRDRGSKLSARLAPSLIRHVYARADIVTANSQANLEALRRLIGGGPRFRMLANPLPRSSELAAPVWKGPPAIDPEALKILAAGRLTYQKGIDLLLRSLAHVRPSCPLAAVIIGDGAERAALEALAERLDLSDSVRFIGFQADPFPFYRWADVVIVPSRFEGYPNVPLESMFLGTPVICTDCPTGPRELTRDGELASLVPVDSVEALAAATLDLANDPDRGARARAASQWVSIRHSDSAVVAALEEIVAIGCAPPDLRASMDVR